MNRERNERFIIAVITGACIGLNFINTYLGWEFWVPPLIITGAVCLWVMQIVGKPDANIRDICYLIYAMLAVFYHGVHETSLYDLAIVISFVLVIYSFMDHVYMMNLLLIEYFVLFAIQLLLIFNNQSNGYGGITIIRLAAYTIIVVIVYRCCVRGIQIRQELLERNTEKDEQIEKLDSDVEDFLSNVSHELRTPVNVVSGMSDILIKKDIGKEAFSIKEAGEQLSYHIEDIQDYTECKRGNIILEEEEYMTTSLINDVVTHFRMSENEKNLILILDLDPNVPTKMKGDVRKIHKIFRHIMRNSEKFTPSGGIYLRLYSENTDYGVNLCIEITDTGIGMSRRDLESITTGMYQANRKRDRSTGGVGLGFTIIFGLVHRMGGFVKVESDEGLGTVVRTTIPQKVRDNTPCLSLRKDFDGDVIIYIKTEKYKVIKLREFYRSMATHLVGKLNVSLYPVESINEVYRLKDRINLSHIFMGEEEYSENPDYFDGLSNEGIVVAVSAREGFKVKGDSKVIVMPKPFYTYPVMKILNEGADAKDIEIVDRIQKPELEGVRALVVDDEPMNLVVATSIFKDYGMIVETATSGRESIKKLREKEYDIIFMDHMMPEMDGVETMKKIRSEFGNERNSVKIVALTANAVSGAREMFIREGFDGFIAKPINITDFERVMGRVLPGSKRDSGGEEI